MHLAAKNGFLPLVQFLLEKSGSNLPVENDTKSHYSPIQLAALGGHKHVVGYLLAHSECRRHHATISLAPAALCGDTALVLFLLEHGADINYQVIENQNLFEGPLYSPTALASAATHGHLALVKLLLDKGSDIDCKTSRGTPLCLAVKNNHEDVIEALVTRGADVSTDILRLAVLNYNKKALELLLANFEHGTCQINLLELAAREGDMEIFKVLMDKGFDREEALVVAIQYDQERIVTFLLEQGTDPDVPSLDKRATSHALSSSRIGILETLLRHGAHIDPECLKRAQLFAPAHIVTLANKFPLLPIESSSKVSRPSPILFGHNLRMAPIPFRI
jgi:ankyrin repeat protein